jgi:hypothetical protein
MTCVGAYGTVNEYADYWCLDTPLTAEATARIQAALNQTAGRIHVARQSAGACDCTLASGAAEALRQLNFVLAAIFWRCPCGRVEMTDAIRQSWLMDAQQELASIANGTLELCEGATGSEYPAVGIIEQSWTRWREAEIIASRQQRNATP